MRIVVSGTHASGKSTLISDFAARHPHYVVLPDPFESLDESWDAPSAGMFAAQLRIAADRLTARDGGDHVIAERGPLDFLAYLLALAELTGHPDDAFLDRARELTADAMRHVELLVFLPLTDADAIEAGADEYPELRQTMNDVLRELVDDPELVDADLAVLELTGSPVTRLAAVDAAVTRPGPMR